MRGRALSGLIGGIAFATLAVSAAAGQRAAIVRIPGQVTPALAQAGQSIAVIHVTALDAKGAPIPDAELRLRDLDTGRATPAQTADQAGECAFKSIPAGTYVAELVGQSRGVDGVSDATTVGSGEVGRLVVRLTDRSRSFAWWLGATTTAALAQAASLGVFAVDSGQPVSPQR
jgi:hypothetical protein